MIDAMPDTERFVSKQDDVIFYSPLKKGSLTEAEVSQQNRAHIAGQAAAARQWLEQDKRLRVQRKLLIRIAHRDANALARLLRLYRETLRTQFFANLCTADAENAILQTFAAVWLDRENIAKNAVQNFEVWLFQAAAAIRTQKEARIAAEPLPEEAAEQKGLLAEQVRPAIDSRNQAIFQLHSIHKESYATIGKMTMQRSRQVKSHWQREIAPFIQVAGAV